VPSDHIDFAALTDHGRTTEWPKRRVHHACSHAAGNYQAGRAVLAKKKTVARKSAFGGMTCDDGPSRDVTFPAAIRSDGPGHAHAASRQRAR